MQPKNLHWYGLMPECILMCVLRLKSREKHLLHNWHLNAFIPYCVNGLVGGNYRMNKLMTFELRLISKLLPAVLKLAFILPKITQIKSHPYPSFLMVHQMSFEREEISENPLAIWLLAGKSLHARQDLSIFRLCRCVIYEHDIWRKLDVYFSPIFRPKFQTDVPRHLVFWSIFLTKVTSFSLEEKFLNFMSLLFPLLPLLFLLYPLFLQSLVLFSSLLWFFGQLLVWVIWLQW